MQKAGSEIVIEDTLVWSYHENTKRINDAHTQLEMILSARMGTNVYIDQLQYDAKRQVWIINQMHCEIPTNG